jgi:hypothetical protein
MFVIISQDMAHRTAHKVSPHLVKLMLIVYQQLLGHVHTTRSRLGPGQHGAEEGRVPLGVYSVLLQQEEHYLGGS